MGHLGAGWLEREDRERSERTDLLIDNLPLGADSVVADIGAGTGYFSFPVAARVPALLWPFSVNREQGLRARRLAERGLLTVLQDYRVCCADSALK